MCVPGVFLLLLTSVFGCFYSFCTQGKKEKKIKAFLKEIADNNKDWSPFHISLLLLKHSAIRLPFSPTAPVRSIYCWPSCQYDIHSSLAIMINSTGHNVTKEPQSSQWESWYLARPQAQNSTYWNRLCSKEGEGSARKGAVTDRDRNKRENMLYWRAIPFHCSA